MYLGQTDGTFASVSDQAPLTAPLQEKCFSDRPAPKGKRVFDLTAATIGLILAAQLAVLLLIVNPFLNPGPVFFRQDRMGKHGERFTMWKFRTMRVCANGSASRPALAPLETNRISPFAQVLRKFRIDELPNFINVLKGEMSVIGPRPDAWLHSEMFWDTVPYYKERFRVLPGITGLAQVRGGYAECADATRRKARFDYFYVRAPGWKMELYVIWRTIRVILTGFGAR